MLIISRESLNWFNLSSMKNSMLKNIMTLFTCKLQLCWFEKIILDWVLYKPSNFQAICSSAEWLLPGMIFPLQLHDSWWFSTHYVIYEESLGTCICLQAARQIEFLVGRRSSLGLFTTSLEDPMAIAQHHDAVSGIAKQHTTDDYSKCLALGASMLSKFVMSWYKSFFGCQLMAFI
jgi:hypothetical protein